MLYDKNENLIGNTLNNKRQFEYIYDAQNRLVQVNRYNDVTGKEVLISFQYDALGRRTSKRVANVVYEYIYSGNDVIEETQSNINATTGSKTKKEMREYTYGARGTDDIVAVRYSTYTRVKKVDTVATTGDYYYEKNHLGSVIRITSSTGTVVDEYSYTVFGKAYRKNTNGVYKLVAGANDSAIGNTRPYTGREYDKEISLYYMRARYYDAGLGRFVSRDPIGMKDNVDLYTYVANSPVGYADRMGLEKALIFMGTEKYIIGNITGSAIKNSALVQYQKYIDAGYKESNIIVVHGENIDDLNTAIQQFNFKDIAVVAHSNESSVQLTYGGEGNQRIDASTVSQLTVLNDKNITLTIDGCMSGYGDHPIAEAIANQVGVTVMAPNSMISPAESLDYFINGGHSPELSIEGIFSPIGAFFVRSPATFITF